MRNGLHSAARQEMLLVATPASASRRLERAVASLLRPRRLASPALSAQPPTSLCQLFHGWMLSAALASSASVGDLHADAHPLLLWQPLLVLAGSIRACVSHFERWRASRSYPPAPPLSMSRKGNRHWSPHLRSPTTTHASPTLFQHFPLLQLWSSSPSTAPP